MGLSDAGFQLATMLSPTDARNTPGLQLIPIPIIDQWDLGALLNVLAVLRDSYRLNRTTGGA